MAKKDLEGGCFCGEVRYRITGYPVLQLYCFCSDCLAISGTDGYAGYMVRNKNFALTKGNPTAHDKLSKEGETVTRYFCPTCGTNLWGETVFGLISVAAGTLDDKSQFQPTKKAFAHDAPAWARVPDGLEDI